MVGIAEAEQTRIEFYSSITVLLPKQNGGDKGIATSYVKIDDASDRHSYIAMLAHARTHTNTTKAISRN